MNEEYYSQNYAEMFLNHPRIVVKSLGGKL